MARSNGGMNRPLLLMCLVPVLLVGCAQLPPTPAPARTAPAPGAEAPARPQTGVPAGPPQYGQVRSIEQIEARDGAVRRYEVLVRLERGGAERWFELSGLDGLRVGERVVIERGRLRRW
jgi:hypothetical protein